MKMIDMKKHLSVAADESWAKKSAEEFAKKIVEINPSVEIDFDRNSGEKWIRIICEGRVIALISTTIKIGFIEYSKVIVPEQKWLIWVQSMDAPCLMITTQRMESFAGRKIPEEIDLCAISPSDFSALTAT